MRASLGRLPSGTGRVQIRAVGKRQSLRHSGLGYRHIAAGFPDQCNDGKPLSIIDATSEDEHRLSWE